MSHPSHHDVTGGHGLDQALYFSQRIEDAHTNSHLVGNFIQMQRKSNG